MVEETGEATAAFLRSVAAGEAEQKAVLAGTLEERALRGREKACADMVAANTAVSGELVCTLPSLLQSSSTSCALFIPYITRANRSTNGAERPTCITP